jgi:CelD/BcsL family acetyltransferase involved in cellulose biosynthesis
MAHEIALSRSVQDIHLIRADQLSELEVQSWDRILASDPGLDHPQLRPEFILMLAQAGRDVEIAVLRDHSEIVGFFPFVRTLKTWAEPAAGHTSDFEAIILRRGVECSISQLLTACGLKGWEFAHLSAHQASFSPYHAYLDEAPYMDLSNGFDGYRETLRTRSSILSNTERKSRKLEREIGPISFEYRSEDIGGTLALLNDWKQRQLQRQGFKDMFQLPWISRLLTICSQQETKAFSGIVSVLKAGDQPVAIHYGLQGERVFLSWIPTYHPSYHGYSPGAQLILRVAEAAASEGVTRIDLGRGQNQLKQSLKSSATMLAIGTASSVKSKTFIRNSVLRVKRQLRSSDWIYSAFRRVKSLTHGIQNSISTP